MSTLRGAFSSWVRSELSRLGGAGSSVTSAGGGITFPTGSMPSIPRPGGGGDDQALVEPVQRFVTEVGRDLDALAGRAGRADGTARQDVAMEAAALVGGVVDADAIHTDDD